MVFWREDILSTIYEGDQKHIFFLTRSETLHRRNEKRLKGAKTSKRYPILLDVLRRSVQIILLTYELPNGICMYSFISISINITMLDFSGRRYVLSFQVLGMMLLYPSIARVSTSPQPTVFWMFICTWNNGSIGFSSTMKSRFHLLH